MDTHDLAYIAGLLDSDGTIGIKKNTYAMRKVGDCGQPTYSERVCVKQVEPQAVDLAHSIFGGYRFIAKPGARNGKPLHGWQVTDRQAVAVLRAVLPYLRIKHLQAENCLALRGLKETSRAVRIARGRGHVGSASRTMELSAAMEEAYQKAHGLNRVGVA